MKRKEFLTVFIGLFFLLSLTALTFSPVPASAAPITLKFAHQNPPKGRTTVKVLDAFIKQMEAATRGKVKIVSYPAQSLIRAKEMITGIENGIADIGWTILGYYSGRFPLTTVTALPFITLNNAEKNSALLQELYDTMPEIQREYRSIKVLFLHATDAMHLFTTKKPVRNMGDLKGLKVRVMGAYTIKAAKLLGLSPLFMPMPGVYEAGEKGVLDGAITSWAGAATFNIHEVYPYYTDADLWSGSFIFFMNKDKWNSLPEDVKKAIDNIGGMKAAKWAGNAGFGPDVKEDIFKKAKKGNKKLERCVLSAGELEKWKKIAGEPIWDIWVKEMKKKGLPGQKVLDKALGLMKKYQ